MRLSGLGIDVVEVKRFRVFGKNKNDRFLLNNFSKKELDYCFSFKDYAPHLAGTFAAKEAIFKALGKNDVLFSIIEIRRKKNGNPAVWIKNHHQSGILVSISHTEKLALAVSIKNE